MRFYQELSLIPNADIDRHFLWSKVFQQIHLGLVAMKDGKNQVPVGIGFPEYQMGDKFGVLGTKLRLFAPDEATMVRFNADQWLEKLSDYVHCTRIREVPANKIKGYALFKRVWPDNSVQNLARRRAKRKAVSLEAALAHFQGRSVNVSNLPNIQLKSQSTGQRYPLLIAKVDATASTEAIFSTYGLSSRCTVPIF